MYLTILFNFLEVFFYISLKFLINGYVDPRIMIDDGDGITGYGSKFKRRLILCHVDYVVYFYVSRCTVCNYAQRDTSNCVYVLGNLQILLNFGINVWIKITIFVWLHEWSRIITILTTISLINFNP